LFTDGSRIIFRLSGTAGSGATIRMYLEQYSPDAEKFSNTRQALADIVAIALKVSNLVEITGMSSPTVIT
jgi:phosphoglucomutase